MGTQTGQHLSGHGCIEERIQMRQPLRRQDARIDDQCRQMPRQGLTVLAKPQTRPG